MVEKWIQKALGPESKGKLHKKLVVPLDEKIPTAKLKNSENAKGALGKEVRLAETLKGFAHKKGK